MRTKILTIVVIALLIYSCGNSKSLTTTKATTTNVTEANEIKKVEMTTVIAEGKNLYENNCAKCHKLYAATDFSKDEWSPIVLRMQKKSHLEEADGQKIYNYLIQQLP